MIRVMVAEDVRILRETLIAVLELEPDLEVVAAVERGDEVEAAAMETRPDVAILDIGLPGMDGLDAAAILRDKLPECRIVALTGMNKPGHLHRALAAGVAGFLLKHSPPAELIDAIRRVAAGARIVDPQLAMEEQPAFRNPVPADADE